MIEINGLTKTYGQHTVVDDLTFNCSSGEVLGFLGPNGAGKSTTMKMITGFVSATAGTASVCGHDVGNDAIAARRRIGYLPEGAPSYPEMTPGSFLQFVADIRELSGSRRKERIDEVVARLHLEPVIDQTIDTLSKGFKRRVGLAQAILHDPDVLILDEPTDGLDPNQKHEVRDLINSMAKDKLIVISTHILEEVEAVCNRAIIIANGSILADDTPQSLAATSRYHNSVRIILHSDGRFDEIRSAVEQLASVTEVESIRNESTIIAMTKTSSERQSGYDAWRDITELAKTKGWDDVSAQQESGRLDEVFRQITGGASA